MTHIFVSAAAPDLQKSMNEYISCVFGAASLGYTAVYEAQLAVDLFHERLPHLVKHRVRQAFNAIDSTRGFCNTFERNIKDKLLNDSDIFFTVDMGNALYDYTKPHLDRLRFAVAAFLGRWSSCEDINAFAALMVAQRKKSRTTARK